jgi:hypothetical protein
MAQVNEPRSLDDEEKPCAVTMPYTKLFNRLKMGTDFTFRFSNGHPDVLFNSRLFPDTKFWNSKFSPNFREQSELTVDQTWNFAALMVTLNDYCNRNDMSATKYPAYVPTPESFPDVYRIAEMVGDSVLMNRIKDYVECDTSVKILAGGELKHAMIDYEFNSDGDNLECSFGTSHIVLKEASLVKTFKCNLFNDLFEGTIFKYNKTRSFHVAGDCKQGIMHNLHSHRCQCKRPSCTRPTDIISRNDGKKVHFTVILEILEFFRAHNFDCDLTVGVLYHSVIDKIKRSDEDIEFFKAARKVAYDE